MEHRKVAALVEIGILCRGEDVPAVGDGGPDPGPHELSGHTQLCRFENPYYHFPYEDRRIPAYDFFPPETPLAELLARTRLFVFLGAADSPQFREVMARPDTLVFLFESDDRALTAFLDRVPLARLNRPGFFLFTGDPYSFNPALQEMLPAELFKRGTPAFFVTDRIRRTFGDWADRVVEYLEVLHYRHAIYLLSGQFMSAGWPFRAIRRAFIYDQQLHGYENVPAYLRFPDISELAGAMAGHTAILVAAGPDLNDRLDWIAANRDRAVVISVNNALKPLVGAGIRPHLTVINDVSLAAGEVFRHIPRVPETILVGHCLSDLGGDRFRQRYLFEDYMPGIFGGRGKLELHGSVISTAFSLARLLGCPRTVLVGAQLCSDNPWGLSYAKGTVKEDVEASGRPLVNEFPQLVPVVTPFGETVYTTVNFRDAALWLAETIRLSRIECVNTSRKSLLFGRGIRHEAAPELPEADVTTPYRRLFGRRRLRPDYTRALYFLRRETELWRNLRRVAMQLTREGGPALLVKGMAVLEQMDGSNVTYLVQRYPGFNNQIFHRACFQGGDAERIEGLRYYYDHVARMAGDLLGRLAASTETCRSMADHDGFALRDPGPVSR